MNDVRYFQGSGEYWGLYKMTPEEVKEYFELCKVESKIKDVFNEFKRRMDYKNLQVTYGDKHKVEEFR